MTYLFPLPVPGNLNSVPAEIERLRVSLAKLISLVPSPTSGGYLNAAAVRAAIEEAYRLVGDNVPGNQNCVSQQLTTQVPTIGTPVYRG